MIEDVVEGIFKVLGRFLGHFLLEVIFELLIKSPGYFIAKAFTKGSPDPDGFIAIAFGILFWSVIDFGIYAVF
jgi:hypothetical protein